MKAIKIMFLVLVMILCAQMVMAQETDEKGLTVRGKARIFAPADRAKISFEIKGMGKSLEAAFDDARTRMDSIATDLYAIGLGNRNIASSFYSSENFGDKAFWSSKKDYKAVLSVCITVDSMALLEPTLIALSKADIEGINDISYELIDFEKIRIEALKEAVRMAKKKSELICEGLGITTDGVIEFEEYKAQARPPRVKTQYSNPFNSAVVMEGSDNEGTSGKFGHEFQFDAEVRVVFSIAGPEDRGETEPLIGERP